MTVSMRHAELMAQPTLGDYWGAVYRKRWLILFLTLAAGVFSMLLSELITPRYEAMAEFYMPQDVSTPVSGPKSGKLRLPSIPDLAEIYGGLLQSDDILRTVVKRVRGAEPGSIHHDTDVVVSSTATIKLYARNSNPEVAKNIVVEWLDAFRSYMDKAVRDDLLASLRAIDGQLKRYSVEQRGVEEARLKYIRKNKIASTTTALAEMEGQRTGYEATLRESKLNLAIAEERTAALTRELEAAMSGLHKGRFGVTIADRLEGQTRSALVDARVGVDSERTRLEGLRLQRKSIDGRLRELPGLILQVGRYDEQLQRIQASVRRARVQRDRLSFALLSLSDSIMVTATAQVPQSPIYPIISLNVALGLFGGLVVGLLYALMLDYGTRRRETARAMALLHSEWGERLWETLTAREDE